MILGHIRTASYLRRVEGLVTGSVITDAKDRKYRQTYTFTEEEEHLAIQRSDGYGDQLTMPSTLELDEALVAFFGLYSGDGAKGSDDGKEPGRIVPVISFSQKEKHLARFALDQFRKLFPGEIRFTFSLGEDSAYFLDGHGRERLEAYYKQSTGSGIPPTVPLATVRPKLNDADQQYLSEVRPDVLGTNSEHLAFYYQHKDAMQHILAAEKAEELASVGIAIAADITVTASLRRPFKKGAREPGGSSRSDEIHLGGVNGGGELFLKIMHEIEDSILLDSKASASGLIEWTDQPSKIGQSLDLLDFFTNNPYGRINNARPIMLAPVGDDKVVGKWRLSSETTFNRHLSLNPLWCYVAGLYLAEGTTPKEALFRMFVRSPGTMAIGFTSSEGISIELMLRSLRMLFPKAVCLDAWKVKVGSQYFPELVVTGLKQGLPMLRGGKSGDGKLRTMEISLCVREWALNIADSPLVNTSILREDYADRYSHVEPTGSGVARIDFWASSTLCRWYFPLLMYTVFAGIVPDPTKSFYQ